MKKAYLLIALLSLHFLILFNIRFTAWPEMLSYPYLFSNGFKLYTDFIYPYPPLLTLLLAGFYKIFGLNILALKSISWLFVLGGDIFLFLGARKILKKESLAFLLLVPYVLIQSFLDGNMLWFDNALVLPVAGALYFLLNWIEDKKPKNLFWTSLFLTIGVFIKQTAVVYFLIFLIFYFWNQKKIIANELGKILLPPILFGGTFLSYLLLSGSFNDFWLWAFYYPLTFWSKFPGYQDLTLTVQEKLVFALTLIPLTVSFLVWKKVLKDKSFIGTLLFLFASILAVYPRFTYFHLQPVFATSFLASAIILSHLKRYWYLILLGTISIFIIYPTLNYSFTKSIRFYDDEDQKVINIVSALSSKEETVSLIALNSSVYVFADRLPPKPWADNFGWYFEVPSWQEKTVKGFEENPPDKIFYKVPERGNWFDLGVYRPQKLVDYMNKHYYRDSEPIAGIELWKRKN